MDNILSYLAIILSLILLVKLLFTIKEPSTTGPPGPLALPIIGHLHLFKKPLHQTLARLASHHGPLLLLRFGSRPLLVVSSPSLAEECFTKNDIAFADRPRFPSVKTLTYNYTVIGSSSYGPHWRNFRRITTVEVLSSHRLSSFSDARATEVGAMARRLFREHSGQGTTRVEMKSRLFELSLNVIMTMVAGKRYYGEGAGKPEEARRFMEIVNEGAEVGGASNIEDFLSVLRWADLRGLKSKIARLVVKRDAFLQGLIEEKRREGEEGNNKNKSMIGVLLSMQQSDPENYTDEVIKALVVTMLTAGTSTSSDTLEWALSLLLNNPEKLKKAQDEIDAQVGNGRLVQEDNLPNLPYLQCIISETLRMYPVAPLLLPHQSSSDCVVGGYNIRSGMMLLVNIYAIQRDPKIWVEPSRFVPERFENGRAEDGRMIPFGMGRRRCPGEGLAMREMGLVLGTLVQCFEWSRVGEREVDMSEGSGLILPKAIPLEGMYKPRKAMADVLTGL